MRSLLSTILIVLGIGFGIKGASAQSCATATCRAASSSEADVLAALPSRSNQNSAVTVIIPTGRSSWASQLNYAVPPAVTNLTIEGQTSVNCSGTAGTSSYTCTATDSTVIKDAYLSSSPIWVITTGSSDSYFRMTGITFEGGNVGSSSYTKYSGMLQFRGDSQNFRIDHCHFDTNTYSPRVTSAAVRLYGTLEGVLDHNVLDLGLNNSYSYINNGFQTFNDIGDGIGNGDGAWAAPTAFGSSEFIFIEENVFNGGVSNDCANSGRFVERYNTFNGLALPVQNHATKSDVVPERGCRAEEIYHNYFTGPSASPEDTAISLKGGTGLIWGNTVASGYTHLLVAETDRNGITGDEKATPTGWGTCGGSTNPGSGAAGPSNWDGNSTSYGYPCLDGIGRGQTVQALNGQAQPNRLNSATNTIAWPEQYLEPIYVFDETGVTSWYTLDHVTEANRDVYLPNSSFDGTNGTGTGLLTNRPTACTAGPGGTYGQSPTGSYGVAYFATDANGGRGELYVCTTTNTWTAVYEPYIYPHPLDGGVAHASGTAPPAPTGLVGYVQ